MPKKTKFTKITDRKKAWYRKPSISKYIIEEVETNKTILIVCEGQTEKLYFESFPVLGLTVEAIDLQGQTKRKLVEITIAIKDSSGIDYDDVWCVFDMDVNSKEKEFADFDNAIESGIANDLEIAYSNDVFELWFYLHYNYTEAQQHRTFYYKELGKQWNLNYEREGKKRAFCREIYSKLEKDEKASQEKAIKRAKKLYEKQKDLVYHQQNPITKVYELVEYLNENSRP